LPQVEDLADTRLVQKLSQVPGVGLVSVSGGQKPAVRIQVNPVALSSVGLTLEDLRTALAQANVNEAKGSFDGARQAYTIAANDQLLSSDQYRPLVIAYRNGAPAHLSDVATVTDDAEDVKQAAWMNTTPAVILNIRRQPGANIVAVVDRIKALLPQLRGSLPPTIDASVIADRTITIRASVKDVEFELMLTVCLVVLVIFLFLRTFAGTLIPGIAVPLSLVGTFGAMYLLGYSLNNLTLMALTISTGFVVDDAIVMIENISRYVEQGVEPLDAALKGAGQIGFTILSLTVSLIAVLIPLLFMSDVVGRLFREFAVTLGVTILVSAAVSLSLTPMMCAKLLRPPDSRQGRFYRMSERAFTSLVSSYGRSLEWVLAHQTATLAVAIATLLCTMVLYVVIRKGFFPVQDTSVIVGISEGPETVSFAAMAERQQAPSRDCVANSPAFRAQPCSCSRCRTCGLADLRAPRNTNTPCKAPTCASSIAGLLASTSDCAACPSSRMSTARSRPKVSKPHLQSIAPLPHASASARRRSTTRCMTRLVSARSRPCIRRSISTTWFWKWIRGSGRVRTVFGTSSCAEKALRFR
jgi:multidrug efflux pump